MTPSRHANDISFVLLTWASMTLCGCHRQPNPKPTIIYDEWWASDYAANSARCGANQKCRTEARQSEADFLSSLKTEFQTDQNCLGLRLFVGKGSSASNTAEMQAYLAIADKPHWTLIVDFTPDAVQQSWQLNYADGKQASFNGDASGLSDARELTQRICSIAGQRGGTVD